MPSFDYIESKELRESLESDYLELEKCAESGAWKGVQVLSGSIVEAILVDYLTSSTHPNRSSKDPLKMDLSEAIGICKGEGVLSARASDLCSVVRSYRNLIHPGRMVRLGEQPPDKTSGTIAVSLVDMISEEVARTRRAAVGLTADQLLSKLIRDANSLSLLKHLLTEVPELQKNRLLFELIPTQYLEVIEDEFDTSASRLRDAYRQILETASPAVRAQLALEFVNVLKGADGQEVINYSQAFFRASDLQFVPAQYLEMVKDHVLMRAPAQHSRESIELLKGVEQFLGRADGLKWLDPIVRTLLTKGVDPGSKAAVRTYVIGAVTSTSEAFDAALEKRLNEWIKHLEKLESSDQTEVVINLKKDIEASMISF